jgi:hypothetical protein
LFSTLDSCEEAEECSKVAERALDRARQVEGDTSELRDLDLLIRQKIELLLEIKVWYPPNLRVRSIATDGFYF